MNIIINEEDILKSLNIDHMRQNIRLQVENKIAQSIEDQVREAIQKRLQDILASTNFTEKIETLLLDEIQKSGEIVFRRKYCDNCMDR
jgi:hypothetical protein